MDAYVQEFGNCNPMPMAEYLRFWYQAKSQYLLPIFQGKLIHEKKINYTKNKSMIEYDLDRLLFDCSEWEGILSGISMMLRYVFFDGQAYWEVKANCIDGAERVAIFDRIMSELFYDTSGYVSNSLHLATPIILRPNRYNNLTRTTSIQNGQKPFRAINSIMKALEPICREKWPNIFHDTFFNNLHSCIEKCRIIHSQVLNSTKIDGTLCLSIHPMDYITMSDNDYDWESCMTWTREDEPGEYRTGTIEMMNSPSVVIAYIKGNKPYFPLEDHVAGPTWSNKKWRELFIVDREFISGVRAYPYQEEEFEDIIIKELAAMAAATGYSSYSDEIHKTENHMIKEGEILIKCDTNIMYNDWCCHTCRDTIAEPAPIGAAGIRRFNYSGTAYCLECGEELFNTGDRDDSSELTCDSCRGIKRCSCCGAAIYDYDDYYTTDDGSILCLDCGIRCDMCGKVYNVEDESLTYIDVGYTNSFNRAAIHRREICTCQACKEKLSPYLGVDIIYKSQSYERTRDVLLPTIPDDLYDEFATWMPDKEDLVDPREFNRF